MTARKQTSIKVDPFAWNSAKEIFKEYGISASDAINIFLNKVRLEGGIPFDMKIPSDRLKNAISQAKNLQGSIDTVTNKKDIKQALQDAI